MINRFIADLNTEQAMPSNSYNNEYVAALDLSRRRDSVETRKTPSPYNTNSSYESASPHSRLDQPMIQLPTNSPNSSSSYAASAYNSSAYMMERPAPLLNQPFQYAFHPASPSERNCFPPQTNFSPVLHRSSLAADHVNTELTHNSGPDSHLHRQSPLNQVSPPAGSSAAEPHRKPNDVTQDQKPINPTVAVVTGTLPPLLYPKLISRDRKIARPFKAYPRDPLAMAATFTATDALLDAQKAEKYSAFRKRMLEQIHASNGGRATVSNPKMRRNANVSHAFLDEQTNDSSSGNEDQSSSGPESFHNSSACGNNNNSSAINQNGIVKDAAYYERRKKNNAAAKKSRDRRRIKEDEIAVRAAFLEHENIELRIELAALKNQLAMLTANVNR